MSHDSEAMVSEPEKPRRWYTGPSLDYYEGPKVPVQVKRGDNLSRFNRLPEPLVRLAFEEYARHHDQTFERLHERGGFGLIELILLLADNAQFWKGEAIKRGARVTGR